MSDEDLELGNAIESDETPGGPAPRRQFMTERLARILMYVLIGIVAVLVSVTVSVLTYRYMDRGSRARQFPVLSENYVTEVPVYDIWNFLTNDGYDLRSQTIDAQPFTVSAKIKLGYNSVLYKELNTELTAKNDALMDTIRFYFSQRTQEQLRDEEAVKRELLSRVNSQLSRGEVEQILFLQYQIIGL